MQAHITLYPLPFSLIFFSGESGRPLVKIAINSFLASRAFGNVL